MKDFVQTNKEKIYGVLDGFDRMIFKGHLTDFFIPKGMYRYMSRQKVYLTTYKAHAEYQTKVLKNHIQQIATTNNVAITYVNNGQISKESIAKKGYEKHPTKQGLICILSTLETSSSFSLRGNKALKELEIRRELRKHLHYYLYYIDEEFGWMHVRIQTWFPFSIQIYINGREYLKRSLDKQGIAYEAYNNSITWVEDIDKAQAISDNLINKKWDRLFNAIANRINPHLTRITQIFSRGYKWTIHQCEYATDVLFHNRQELEAIYPALLNKATLFRGGEDIYSFFGRNLHGNSTKEVVGSNKRFLQGFRVKHQLDKNSIKMYDKHKVLRVETTINNSKAFKVYKDAKRKGQKTKAWVPMGKAVSNLYRYAQIARAANYKYLNSLADVRPPNNLDKTVEKISQSVTIKNSKGNDRRISPFNLLKKDTSLILEAINDARFFIRPFNNKQLREVLIQKKVFGINTIDIQNDKELRRFSNKISRLIAKLRGHKIIRKIGKSFTYKVTKVGQQIIDKILQFKKVQLQSI